MFRKFLLRGVEGGHLLLILYETITFNAKKSWFLKKKFLISWFFLPKKCLTDCLWSIFIQIMHAYGCYTALRRPSQLWFLYVLLLKRLIFVSTALNISFAFFDYLLLMHIYYLLKVNNTRIFKLTCCYFPKSNCKTVKSISKLSKFCRKYLPVYRMVFDLFFYYWLRLFVFSCNSLIN